jgi:crossover junction endodeoxyribonuclease RuvC
MPRSSAWRSYKPGAADAAPASTARRPGASTSTSPRPSVPYRVLGLDPGSRATGYGVIEIGAEGPRYLASGTVRAAGTDFAARLREIYVGVAAVVDTYRPDEIAIEKVFVNRNVDSALKLGQARGAALAATFADPVPVAEYAPREVKLAVVGTGAAEKGQVQKMVTVLLGLEGRLAADAADALAVALCHAHASARRDLLARHGGTP